MSAQESPASFGAYEDPFTLDEDLPKLSKPAAGPEPAADKYKQKPSVVKREKHMNTGLVKNKDRKAAEINAKEKQKKAKAAAAEGARKPGRPAIPAEVKMDMAERIQRSREAAEKIIRESINHAVFCIEQDFTRAFLKCTKGMKAELISSIRHGCDKAVQDAIENIHRSTATGNQ